jgi:nitrite reductase/ring-hydroxylating ferredoxin subunit
MGRLMDRSAPVGTIVGLQVQGTAYAAIHREDGWVMVVDECPHAQCSFTENGEVADGTVLICNCHGAEFDLRTGAVLQDPATEDLQILPLP